MKKTLLYIIFAVALGTGIFLYYKTPATAPKKDQEKIGLEIQKVRNEEVTYYGNVKGYLAYPIVLNNKNGRNPGIILIHEWWGLNDDIKELADKFAREGYVALAVDMYGGKTAATPDEARALSGAVRNNTEEAFKNLNAAVAYLKTRNYDVDPEKLASVGWCFGGGWSYQMAINNLGTKASVMYYGQFDPEDDFEHMKAGILGHFGEKDTGIAINTVKEFQARLSTANGTHEVYIYPNAGHGFANNRGGTNQAYDQAAANLAWDRTLSFLNNILN